MDFNDEMKEGDTYTLKHIHFKQDQGFENPITEQSLKNIVDGIKESGLNDSLDKTQGVLKQYQDIEDNTTKSKTGRYDYSIIKY